MVAAIVSGVIFLTLQKITDDLIEGYLSSEEYYHEESARYIQKFSKYVSENELSTSDRKAFGEWVKKENYINLTIFKDQELQYDSIYSESDYGKEKLTQYAQNHSHPVKFSDGEGRVIIDGFYSSRYYDLAFALDLLGATLIFLIIVLFGIRQSLRYLKTIHQEIHILEGGELDYEMTIKGHDELAMIAKSIEDLRKASFLLSFCMILFLCFIGKQAACNPNLLLFTTVLSVVCGICHHSRIFPAKSYKNSRMRRL